MKIKQLIGFSAVPKKSKDINLSSGKGTNVALIIDRKGVLPRILVKSERPLQYLTPKEEEAIVQEVIQDMPEYLAVKDQELPYPPPDACKDEWIEWMKSHRLKLCPCEMFGGKRAVERLLREMKNNDLDA